MEFLFPLYHIKDIDVSSTHATDLTSSPEDLSFADPVLQLWSHHVLRCRDHDRNGGILYRVGISLWIVVVDHRASSCGP